MSDQEAVHDSVHESSKIRVLVVDDSALMRRLLTDLLGSVPEIEVIGAARNGREAILQAARLKPDVITLDVEMPEVSGLEALPTLLSVHDAAVVMVSALTQEGAEVTLQALELGAFDFMPKPERNQLAEIRANRELLIGKVLSAAHSRVRRPRRPAAQRSHRPPSAASSTTTHLTPSKPSLKSGLSAASGLPSALFNGTHCVVIGISTGGPQALSEVFPLLAPPLPPILVVQHMPAQYTGVFAERLNRYTALTVKHAEEGEPVTPDHIFIAPGGMHMMLTGHPPRVRIALSDDPPVSGHRPSIDVLFQSAARAYQSAVISFLMTGMGRDGVEGSKAILAAGGLTLGQDEESSAVYGMNKAAFQEGALKAQFALDELPGIIQNIAAFRASLESPSVVD